MITYRFGEVNFINLLYPFLHRSGLGTCGADCSSAHLLRAVSPQVHPPPRGCNPSRHGRVEQVRATFATARLRHSHTDHVNGTYVKGFRMLTLGWSDGNTFLPLSHCLLSSSSKQQQLQGALEYVDPRSNGGKQRKLAQCKAPEVVLTLLREAREAGVPAQHVLFDSWFCSPASLHQIHELGYDVIARVKKSEKMHFCFQGRMQDVKTIYRSQKKRRGCSAYLLSVEAEAVKDGKHLPVRLVYVRNKNKRSDYLVLVSTDLTLSEEEIIQTYGKRRHIEVFFKRCKSYLKLGKETRSISYDALTAHTAIVSRGT